MSGRTPPGGGTAGPGGTAVIDDVAGGSARPASRHLGLALFVIATAQLMVVLDATIVNVALPNIQHALGFSGSGLEWVVNAYALTFGGLLLLGGRAENAPGPAAGGSSSPASCCSRWPRCSAGSPRRRGGCWPPGRCRASAARSSRRPLSRWS